jgi:putative DNA methylase
MSSVKSPKKLIEVALPLDAINIAASKEKSIRHGHPSTLHLWWARRPLAAARAVLFAQLVNDPGYERHLQRGVNKEEAVKERERLFGIIEKLVLWENTNNEAIIAEASAEIWKSWRETCALNRNHPEAAELFNPEKLPAFHDPFAGGGAIPLEAQRLGLESYASDLNPVAVTINKAMIEIPPKFSGRVPVGPLPDGEKQGRMAETWPGVSGLAEDVRRYGVWMRTEAEKRIGHLYPKIKITQEMAKERPDLEPLIGESLTVVAWVWVRTVRSPNPAYSDVHVPLASTFMLSNMAGKEAYVEPVIKNNSYSFSVRTGAPSEPEAVRAGTKLARGASFRCLLSGTPISSDHVKAEGTAGRMDSRMMAIVAEGNRCRVYLSPTKEMEEIAGQAAPSWKPSTELAPDLRALWTPPYGLSTYGDLFTPRQIVALTTFSDLVEEARVQVMRDAVAAGMPPDERGLEEGGMGAQAYSDAVAVYLAFLVSKLADKGSTICTWDMGPVSSRTASGRSARVATVRVTFSRQGLPMTWDFAEVNFFSESVGAIETVLKTLCAAIQYLPAHAQPGSSRQMDAATISSVPQYPIVSTDPPYYDNIGYADLSDFFYVWLRRSLKQMFPQLFATLAVPKAEELIASPYRHGNKEKAESFFLEGMSKAIHNLAERAHPAFPVSIYYAFKQSDTTDKDGTSSAGWETFLGAVLRAGFTLTGTWPMRTELGNRMIGSGANALASSIIMICRKRALDAPTISRREFIRELNAALPESLIEMTGGGVNSPVAPVDLSQAMIGPGMAIFSKYSAVLESDGKPMSVRTALQLINRFLAEDDFDHDTQFCLRWFEGYGWNEGKYGEADVLARAKGTSIGDLNESGVVESGGGKIRLLRWTGLAKDWIAQKDNRTPIWEGLHQMIRALNQDDESAAGDLLARMPMRAEPIRALAYRLYTLCERKGWAEDARSYNELIGAWSAIERAANESGQLYSQPELF